MAPRSYHASRHHRLSDAEAMAMALAALETARQSLHPATLHAHITETLGHPTRWLHHHGRRAALAFTSGTLPLPEFLVIAATLLTCAAGALLTRASH